MSHTRHLTHLCFIYSLVDGTVRELLARFASNKPEGLQIGSSPLGGQ